MTKAQLIGEIYKAFERVTLEDGVGLWEANALDFQLQGDEYKKLKAKDERCDWQIIPILWLYECSSSLSFFDPKGVRFHLGLYLLFALDIFMDEEDTFHEDKEFNLSPPELEFALTYKLHSEYSIKRFSLLNNTQIQCVVYFLEYLLSEKKEILDKGKITKSSRLEEYCKEIEDAIAVWISKIQ